MIPSQELLMQQIFQIYLKSVIWEEHFEHIWEEHFEHIRAHLRGTHADQTARHWRSWQFNIGVLKVNLANTLSQTQTYSLKWMVLCTSSDQIAKVLKTIKIKCMNDLTFDTIHFNPNKLMKHCSVW